MKIMISFNVSYFYISRPVCNFLLEKRTKKIAIERYKEEKKRIAVKIKIGRCSKSVENIIIKRKVKKNLN